MDLPSHIHGVSFNLSILSLEKRERNLDQDKKNIKLYIENIKVKIIKENAIFQAYHKMGFTTNKLFFCGKLATKISI